MKILFAVSNEEISESIIKKYQQEHKEIISSKNVYYFNAIIKELQKNKSYDRIVISEDLEPFANNNYEVIDKFIFEKLDNISDEATKNNGDNIPIILICADRRVKSENLLVKLFGIGVYSALLGQDRSVTNVCELINMPRSKKDAKVYYKIDADDVDTDNGSYVSEVELQNILNHYKRLGKNEEKYVESFDSIATQYTDMQLRIICRYLPLNVKAVLEASSQKYQELITFGTVTPSISVKGKSNTTTTTYNNYHKNVKSEKVDTKKKLDIIEKNIGKSNLTRPVVIPSSINTSKVKKANENNNEIKEEVKENKIEEATPIVKEEKIDITPESVEDVDTKRKRGRPKKVQPTEEPAILPGLEDIDVQKEEVTVKKKRGRPKKIQPTEVAEILPGFEEDVEKKEDDYAINLFDLAESKEKENDKEEIAGIILPGFEEEIEEQETTKIETQVENNGQEKIEKYIPPSIEKYQNENTKNKQIENTSDYGQEKNNIDSVLTRERKIAAFVGTSKNGTSFLVNNLAELMSKKGINTAILDLTKNKNAYYIYTNNEEELRKKAYDCISNLKDGIIDGIKVNKNLTVFTSLPEENPDINDYKNILSTLARNYSLILLDCDFDTEYGYFDYAQEIYLVQSFDILTIQPLTAFLRDLQARNILKPEKLRIVLNKVLKVRSLTEKTIIGGMAFYNDPSMSIMAELFDKDNIKYCTIPFEEQTYSRYLEGLVNCKISINGYSKSFIMSLDKLSNMVYPLLSAKEKSKGKLNAYKTKGFSNDMNTTLDKMKNKY